MKCKIKTELSSVLILFLTVLVFGCLPGDKNEQIQNVRQIQAGKEYKVAIVMDTIDDWSSPIRDGFRYRLNTLLNDKGASAHYTVYDTELNVEKTEEIVAEIRQNEPDLICTINYPTVFADTHVSQKLTDSKFKIVSENCMPVKSGAAKSWNQPGGNITGVSVFLQMHSPMRLMKLIDPQRNKLVFYSWDKVSVLNKWFRNEIEATAKEENITLIEFREVKHQEEAFELFSTYKGRKDVFFMGGVSPFVHKDGSPASDLDEARWIREKIDVPFVIYDETAVHDGFLAGVCVIWADIGAQLAEKGARILDGEEPSEMAWDYPRKYDIILNSKRADSLGINFDKTLLDVAYRIYTDYDGNYINKGKLVVK